MTHNIVSGFSAAPAAFNRTNSLQRTGRVITLLGALLLAACGGSDSPTAANPGTTPGSSSGSGSSSGGGSGGTPPPAAQNATVADLANNIIAFSDGVAFDPALANQAVSLTMGAFDGSNTAPFRFKTDTLSASGVASLNSPLTLNFRIVDVGLPFTDTPVVLDATKDDANVITVTNQADVQSVANAAAVASATPPVAINALLTGGQEVPAPVTTTGTGSATFVPSEDGTSVDFRFDYTGLQGVLQAHLHVGKPGENGGVAFFLCATDLATPVAAPVGTAACPADPGGALTGSLAEADLIAGPFATFAEALVALGEGNLYLNVHTAANPGGEIRGHVGPVTLAVAASGNQEVPPVVTAAAGSGSISINATGTEISYNFGYADVVDVLQAHVHVGIPGSNGGPALFLCATDAEAPVAVPGTIAAPQQCPAALVMLEGTATAADFVAVPGAAATYQDFVAALLEGDTYINVHTTANMGGEIRGQIGATAIPTTLSGARVVPATASLATGTAVLRLNAEQDALAYALSHTGAINLRQGQVRVGNPAENGDTLFFLCATDLVNPVPAPADTQTCGVGDNALTGNLVEADVNPTMVPVAIAAGDLPAAVDAILSTNTHVMLLTADPAANDIRGQFGPTVNFAAQIQPIFDDNCVACHGAAGGLSLAAGVSHRNLVGTASAQAPALSRVTPRDPDNSYLIQKERGDLGIVGGRMPANNLTLFDDSPELLELQLRWINEGAPNN